MPVPLTPRSVAGLLATPGCERRSRLVASGVDLDSFASKASGQSPFALARAGIEDQLHEYPADEPVWLGTDPPPIDGWAANVGFLDHLAQFRTPA